MSPLYVLSLPDISMIPHTQPSTSKGTGSSKVVSPEVDMYKDPHIFTHCLLISETGIQESKCLGQPNQ